MYNVISSSVWLAVTTTSMVLIFLCLWLYLWHTRLVGRHKQYVIDVAELETRKQQLDIEIKQKRQWMMTNKAAMIDIEAQRERHAQFQKELENMQITCAKEEERLEEIRKKSVVLKSVVASLTRERERLQEKVEALRAQIEDARLETAQAEKLKMMAVLRTNMALMDLKAKRNELQELTALYDKHLYHSRPSDSSPNRTSQSKQAPHHGQNSSNHAVDDDSDIHIKVL